MSKCQTATVVHSNKLINACYSLTLDEMRVLNLALTKIDSRKKSSGAIDILPEDFANLYSLPKKNVWRNLEKSLSSIMKKPIVIYYTNGKGKLKKREIPWIVFKDSYVDPKDGSKITISFSDHILPYLFELQKDFTSVNIEYVARLNTSFSFRLYQWLVQEFQSNYNGSYNLLMTIEEIKRQACLEGNYTLFKDFHRRVIKPAVKAINHKTNLSVTYEIILKSNKAHAISFTYIDEHERLSSGEVLELGDQQPYRPRLLRRPKVTKGSHAEGEWQKTNLKLLRDYQTDLKTWDSTAKLTMADLKKLIEYSRLFDSATYDAAVKELEERQSKQKPS